jgi:hypothetical protein
MALSPDQVEQLDCSRFVVVPGLLAPGEAAATAAGLGELVAAREAVLRGRPGGRPSIGEPGEVAITACLFARSAVARRLSADPPIVALARDLVGGAVRLCSDRAVYELG